MPSKSYIYVFDENCINMKFLRRNKNNNKPLIKQILDLVPLD